MPKLPEIIAHRGASGVAPEGTKAAIQSAIKASNWIELDVQLTLDGKLIVFHDSTLRRTTNGTGKVSEVKFSKLAELDAGSWFGDQFFKERILLVSQAIEVIPSRVGIILDIKATAGRRSMLIRHLKTLIVSLSRVMRIIVSSQDVLVLQELSSLPVLLGLISAQWPSRSLRIAAKNGCYSWHPKYNTITARHIIQAHQAGLNVFTWTIDNARLARKFVRWNVDGIFTNNPTFLRRAIH